MPETRTTRMMTMTMMTMMMMATLAMLTRCSRMRITPVRMGVARSSALMLGGASEESIECLLSHPSVSRVAHM